MAEQLGLAFEEKPPRRRRASALRSYHVRAHVDAEAAIVGDVRALRQEDRVLAWMRTNPGRWTPWDVAAALELHVVSARRALTNLAVAGRLVHHPEDRRASGPLGAKSGTWEAAP